MVWEKISIRGPNEPWTIDTIPTGDHRRRPTEEDLHRSGIIQLCPSDYCRAPIPLSIPIQYFNLTNRSYQNIDVSFQWRTRLLSRNRINYARIYRLQNELLSDRLCRSDCLFHFSLFFFFCIWWQVFKVYIQIICFIILQRTVRFFVCSFSRTYRLQETFLAIVVLLWPYFIIIITTM